jgi:hypothetical protein
MKKILNWLIILIGGLAVIGAFALVMSEWESGDVCPRIFGFPTCYIVLGCFTGAFIAHFFKGKGANRFYLFFIGILTFMGLTATIRTLAGISNCPETEGGIPLCFLSLGVSLTLLIAKIVLLRHSKSD